MFTTFEWETVHNIHSDSAECVILPFVPASYILVKVHFAVKL